MKKLFLLSTVLFSLLATAPVSLAAPVDQDPVDPSITNGSAAREFREARAQWLAHGASDYRFKLERSCFCIRPSEVVVTVRGGKPSRISARPWYGPRTIPGLFRVVAQAIKSKAAVLDITYNPELGYVQKAWIDYEAMAVDEEMGYRVSGFRRIATPGDFAR